MSDTGRTPEELAAMDAMSGRAFAALVTAPTGLVTDSAETLAEALGEHRYRDVLGDYEVAPFYKHFGCACGWEQNIAGMSGWRSWIAAHDAHVAAALIASGAVRPAAEVRAEVWDEGFASGKSRAMRYMSDEPSLSLDVPSPYRAALAEEGGR